MSRHLSVLLSVVVISCVAVVGTAAEDAKSEFEGTWEMLSLERDGKAVTPQKETKMVTTGNKFVVQVAGKTIAGGTFVFDRTKTPKTVDVAYTEGPDKGKTLKGIYELTGDTSRFCRAGAPDQERPTEFTTKGGTGALLSVYKRAK